MNSTAWNNYIFGKDSIIGNANMPPVRTHITVSIEAIDAGAASIEHFHSNPIPYGYVIDTLSQC